jgi:anti-sigma-K factor RskA
MTEEHVSDLLPGYALGCLDEQELLTVARHLSHCAMCRRDLSAFLNAADQVALAIPQKTPPVDLKQKILRRAEQPSTQAAPVPVTPSIQRAAPAKEPARKSWLDTFRNFLTHPAGLAFSAVTLLLVIFLAASNLLLWQKMNDLQSRVPQGNMQLVRLVGTDNAPQAQGYLMVFKRETYGTLVIENAPPLKPGYQYQLWLVRDGKRTSGGVFSVSEDGYGTVQVISSQPLESYPSFGITIEPAGGSPAPTGKKVLGGKF